jgi:hypothetical protein
MSRRYSRSTSKVVIVCKLALFPTDLTRSSRVIRASGCQQKSHNGPGFNPSILRQNEMRGVKGESALNIVLYIK